MRKYLSIDLGRCSECQGCVEVAPQVFRYNSSTGMMEVISLDSYPDELVEEAIKNCPEDCICWEVYCHPRKSCPSPFFCRASVVVVKYVLTVVSDLFYQCTLFVMDRSHDENYQGFQGGQAG